MKTTLPHLWHVAGGVLLGCALTLLLLHASRAFSRENPTAEPSTLATKLGPVRLTEGRVDGQTAYAQYRKRFLRRDPALEQFQREVRESKTRPSPVFLRDRAFFYLLSDNLDRAIADLEEASRMAPGEAALLSDLSAVYAERAHVKSRPEDYVTALEMAERAVMIQPDLPEAVFNRVLALEHLFLFDSARDGWRRYLEIDARSPWADEARAHVAKLTPNRPAVPHAKLEITGLPRIAETLHALGDDTELARIENRLADSLQALGQPGQAWRSRYLCLAWAGRLRTRWSPASQKLHTALEIFEGAARDALRQRRPEAALVFQAQALTMAEALRRPEAVVLTRLNSSRLKAALGRQDEARRDFGLALRALQGVQSGDRERLAARLDIARQDIEAGEDRVAGLASEFLPSGHLDAQASFEFQRGDTAAAEGAIRQALVESERRRVDVAPGAYRVSFFDQARPYFERMVALKLHLGKSEEALEVLERFRARTLLDQIGESSTTTDEVSTAPLEWRDLCRRLPKHTVIVVYAVVEDRLVTWLVRSSGIWLSPIQPDWTPISALALSFGKVRLAGPPEKLLERLHNELIAPWKREIRDGDRLIFVPTRDLYRVPFAALRDPVSGRYLIQDHAVGIAPSASEFVAALERDRRLSARPLATVLLVGDPAWDRQSKLDLPAVPGSAQEIQELSRLYQGLNVQVLTKARATPANVLAVLGGSDVVHLGVHALKDPLDPAPSGLVLSPSQGNSGELTARDLVGKRLPRTRLVVLASCGSNSGPVSDSEGSLSLAHSFLAAGVPAVVGSLWEIDDKSTALLSVRFHQELLRGADALTALRTAQLVDIEAGSSLTDWTWASFQVFGGVEARVP